MADIGFNVLEQQYLDRHIPDVATLSKEVVVWGERVRNCSGANVDRQVTTGSTYVNRNTIVFASRFARWYESVD
jgi:hypothetical protein